jgi:single-stranded DNA-binding protein
MAEWRGITINEACFLGKVVGDPTIVETQGGNKCAFISLKTYVNELAANGQWAKTPMHVPLVFMDSRKAIVVEKYVQDGRELYVRSYYKAWKDANGDNKHGLIVTYMELGSKKFVPKEDAPALS